MRGYWGDAAATAHRYRPGPLPNERVCYSGDLFRMDADGFLLFVARKDDIIKSRGEKVAPKEVENVLYAIEGVVEAAVVGVPDPVLGEGDQGLRGGAARPAYAVRAGGRELTEAEVLHYCRARLEDFMVPQSVGVPDGAAQDRIRQDQP